LTVDGPTLWLYAAPPIAGAIIGYFTNDIAIRMLFRPYKAKYIGKWQIPFTPGVIPRNQARLAQRIADSIMKSLLTPAELENIARRLLNVDRVQAAILWLLRLALDQVRVAKQQKTSAILANVLRDLFGESLPKLLQSLADREDFLEEPLNQIFDQVLLEFQFDPAQAKRLAEWLLGKVLSPDVLRLGLVDFLTDRNIQTIDDRFREKSSGTYWVVANLFGLKNSLVRLRSFCLDEPENSDAIIRDLIQSLAVRDRLQRLLQDFSLQNLPVSTVRQLRKTMGESVRRYLKTSGVVVLQGVSATVNWDTAARLILSRLQQSSVMDESLALVSAELAAVLERYLEKDLELIVAQAIPILQIDKVIIDRVTATPAAEMEAGINELIQSELQAIVNLGGVLGLVIGLVQSATLLWR
jgi:uncharacterized membrane protein YheB (UPF0754 family)